MEIQKILFPEVGRCTEKELYFRTEQECSSVSEDIPYEQTLFENEKKALAAVENNKKIEYLPEEKKEKRRTPKNTEQEGNTMCIWMSG